MCSTYISFSAMPEDLDALKQNSAMYYCRFCKKAFMKKNASECPNYLTSSIPVIEGIFSFSVISSAAIMVPVGMRQLPQLIPSRVL